MYEVRECESGKKSISNRIESNTLIQHKFKFQIESDTKSAFNKIRNSNTGQKVLNKVEYSNI